MKLRDLTKIWDAVDYNRGRGAADGNNYWRRFTASHYTYVGVMLFVLSAGAGAAALFGAAAVVNGGGELIQFYLREALVPLLNILPCVVLAALVYFATGTSWLAYYVPAALSFAAAIVVSFGLGDNWSTLAISVLAALVAGMVFASYLMRGELRNGWVRAIGTGTALVTAAVLLILVYTNDGLYASILADAGGRFPSELACGAVYEFLHGTMSGLI